MTRKTDDKAEAHRSRSPDARPDGPPLRDFPLPVEAHRARARAHHLALQPEGRRRQDDDDHQPGRDAGRVRPPRAGDRLRPAGRALGRPRRRDLRRDHRLRPPPRHGEGPGRGDPVDERARARHHPGQHRPLGRRGPPRQRGRPRADPRPGPPQGERRLRRHPHRLPALARPAHRERAHREPRRADPARVRVLRPARCGPPDRDDRQGARPPQSGDRADGILPTMYDSRTLHSREVLDRVVDAFGDSVLETVIGRTVKFPDASVSGCRSRSSRRSTTPRRRTASSPGS